MGRRRRRLRGQVWVFAVYLEKVLEFFDAILGEGSVPAAAYQQCEAASARSCRL